MTDLRISMLQTDIVWEDKKANLRLLRARLNELKGATEIVVLPEMFSTGFSMRCSELAEMWSGETMCALRGYAAECNLAITGSFICCDDSACHGNDSINDGSGDGSSDSDSSVSDSSISGKRYLNRAFFISPTGECYHYDKRHLFRMGDEGKFYSAGNGHTTISYLGWNISLQICYDLRFPVWSRNTGCGYDLLIYVANWPESRQMVWDTLLRARALENMCYVCGVNRIGTDGMQLHYYGGSAIISPKGEYLARAESSDLPHTATISLDKLRHFRSKFPAWMDADEFEIKN